MLARSPATCTYNRLLNQTLFRNRDFVTGFVCLWGTSIRSSIGPDISTKVALRHSRHEDHVVQDLHVLKHTSIHESAMCYGLMSPFYPCTDLNSWAKMGKFHRSWFLSLIKITKCKSLKSPRHPRVRGVASLISSCTCRVTERTGAAFLKTFERLHRAKCRKSKSVGFPRTGHVPVAICSGTGRRFIPFA